MAKERRFRPRLPECRPFAAVNSVVTIVAPDRVRSRGITDQQIISGSAFKDHLLYGVRIPGCPVSELNLLHLPCIDFIFEPIVHGQRVGSVVYGQHKIVAASPDGYIRREHVIVQEDCVEIARGFVIINNRILPRTQGTKRYVSLPLEPTERDVSSSSPPYKVSFPAPPSNVSSPDPPASLSVPSPPRTVSLPASPKTLSSPGPPSKMSSAPRP